MSKQINKICKFCDRPFQTNVGFARYCSHECAERSLMSEYICSTCGVVVKAKKSDIKNKKTSLCRSCSSKLIASTRKKLSGAEHPQWRGGWKYWNDGHRGTDPTGLCWNTQRRLAWERDKDTCQHCGFTKPNWHPAVHHIKPYRLSKSHALDNLICLCPKCHAKADNLITENGQRYTAPGKHPPCRDCGSTRRKLNKRGYCCHCSKKHTDEPTRPKTPEKYCSVCVARIRVSLGGICSICKRDANIRLVKKLFREGLTPSQVMKETGLARTLVHRYRHSSESGRLNLSLPEEVI